MRVWSLLVQASVLTGMALAGLSGCGPKEPSRFEVVLHVESDPGQPLEAAKILHEGRLLAETDSQGSTRLRLSGTAGEVIALHVTCPEDYRTPNEPVAVVLKPLVEQARIPEYRVACPPLVRSLVVAVRAQNGPDLPLKYLGKEIARTDALGACHALLKVRPGETVILTLDTSDEEHAKLMPQNPELKLTVPERDELVVFDQVFTREPDKTVRRKKRVVGPTRI